MAVQLYVRSEPFGPTANPIYQWYQLDLFGAGEPIKLNLSVSSITDPLKVASAFTRTFSVPNTQKNAEFFRTAFNVNTKDFNPARKIPAYINDTGETLVNGNIRLNNIVRDDQNRAISYELGFFGETSDLGSAIAGKYLSDLDMSQFNHSRTYASITNSWTPSGILGGAIRYPLVEWGYTYDSTPAPTLPTLSNGSAKSFTVSQNALQLNQWKPAIQLKVLWDAVISQTDPYIFSPYGVQTGMSGYTYSSDSFMNTALFRNLYVLLDNKASATLEGPQTFTARLINTPGLGFAQVIDAGTTQTLKCNIIGVDPGNNYNATTYTYTCPSTGTYRFKASTSGLSYSPNGSFSPLIQGRYRIKIVQPNGSLNYVYDPLYYNFGYSNQNTSQEIYAVGVLAGTQITMELQLEPTSNYSYYQLATNSNWQCSNAPAFINIKSLMPTNIKITDFIKGVVDKFKLVFIPNPDKPKEFKIIPWIDWVRSGTARDWTDKLDMSKDFKLTPLFSGQTRNNVFKAADDADYLNYNYQLAYKESYGQLNLDSGNELLTGQTVRESIFASTPLDSIGSTTDIWKRMLIPHIAKDSPQKREPIQPKLRLVFWNGMIDNVTNSGSSVYKWYLRNDAGNAIEQLKYPLVSEFQAWPVGASSFTTMYNWKPPIYDSQFGPISNPEAFTGITAYNQYWSAWYQSVYDNYSKLVEANFVLDYSDIKDLKFNDYIWVKDAWYFVDSITDFVVGQSTNVRVKLFKVSGGLSLSIPTGINILPSVSLCYSKSLCGAKCCSGGALAIGNYWTATPNAMVSGASTLYVDPYGDTPASAGYYRYGSVVWLVGENGIYIGVSSPFCVCKGATPGVTFTTKFANNIDSVSCSTPIIPPTEVILYPQQSDVYEENVEYFLDEESTIPAPTGYYRLAEGDPFYVIELQDGVYTRTDTIEQTNCPIPSRFYPHSLAYSFDIPQDACCFVGGTIVYYSTDEVLTIGSTLFVDEGITIAVDGIYSNGLFTYTVGDGVGTILSSADCAYTCPDTEDISLSFVSEYTGFEGLLILEKSFDGVEWFKAGQIAFPDSTLPNTPVTGLFPVEVGAFTRAIVTYTGPYNFIIFSYLLDLKLQDQYVKELPLTGEMTLTAVDRVDLTVTREYTVEIREVP